MVKCNKISSKMCQHLVQQIAQRKVRQKVQQTVHNNYAALLIKRFLLTKLVESLY